MLFHFLLDPDPFGSGSTTLDFCAILSSNTARIGSYLINNVINWVFKPSSELHGIAICFFVTYTTDGTVCRPVRCRVRVLISGLHLLTLLRDVRTAISWLLSTVSQAGNQEEQLFSLSRGMLDKMRWSCHIGLDICTCTHWPRGSGLNVCIGTSNWNLVLELVIGHSGIATGPFQL